MTEVETIEYNGHFIKIVYDENAESPREWDNLGTLCILKHDRYNFPFESKEISLKSCGNGVEGLNALLSVQLGLDYEPKETDFEEAQLNARLIKKFEKTHIIFGIELRGNYSLPYTTNAENWVTNIENVYYSNQPVGYIFCSKEKAKAEFSNDSARTAYKKTRDCLEREIELYRQWANGEVYGFLTYKDLNDVSIDSCFGFYTIEEAIEHAKSDISSEVVTA